MFFSKKVFCCREINRVGFQNAEGAEKGIRFLMAQWAIKNLIQVGEKRFVIFDRWKWLLYTGLSPRCRTIVSCGNNAERIEL